jgi:hypothetical protein
MGALVLSNHWQSDMGIHLHAFCSCGAQQASQRAPYEFVAAGSAEGVIENAKQDPPRWVLGVTDVRGGIVLLKSNDSARA